MRIVFVGDWVPVKVHGHSCDDKVIIGNLECIFADQTMSSGKAYTSVLPISCLDNIAASGFAALSVANNHVYDAGKNGFKFLLDELKRRNVNYFGTCERPYAKLTDGARTIAVIGCLEPCRSRGSGIFRQEDVVSLIQRIRGDLKRVYVYPHWGMEGEYTRYPSPQQRKLAKLWIDAGADGVFGSHSHVFQGKEDYRGKPIYYSLGNYFFPHPESKLYAGTHDGLSVEIDNGRLIEHFHHFDDDGNFSESSYGPQTLSEVGEPLCNWNTWKWAKAIGAFNLKKCTASWGVRLKRNFWRTLPKFLVWQILPKTLLFRIAGALNGECDHEI